MSRFWLFKTEPDAFSIQDLASSKGRRTSWEGVRNYQARNMLRDEIHPGDGVLIYHSRVQPMAIVGTAEVVRGGYPDHFAQDPSHPLFDPKSTADAPIWYMVDIRLIRQFRRPVTRPQLMADPATSGMQLLKKGSRLSVQPVTEPEWLAVHRIAQERTA